MPAPAPPPEDPLAEFNTLRDLCQKVLPPTLADEVFEVLEKKAGITGEGQEWRNKLYDKVLDKEFFRLPLTKMALSHVHQAVQPREGTHAT